MLHKTRELLIKQQTMSVNALRGHLAEFGIVAAKGIGRVDELIEKAENDATLPAAALAALRVFVQHRRRRDRRKKPQNNALSDDFLLQKLEIVTNAHKCVAGHNDRLRRVPKFKPTLLDRCRLSRQFELKLNRSTPKKLGLLRRNPDTPGDLFGCRIEKPMA